MKTIDALSILSINEKEISLEQVKSAYRKACKIYHPDVNPAGTAMMQAVNEAFESLSKDMGLTIEICGAWLWISGQTKPHKEALKSAGFIWSMQKEMWYFRPHFPRHSPSAFGFNLVTNAFITIHRQSFALIS